MAQIIVAYPSGLPFDMDYYLGTHMPLASETWKSAGLLRWEVLTFQPDAPYQVQATLHWTSLEAFDKVARDASTAKVISDTPNFTSAKPVILKGNVVATKEL